MLQMSAMPCTCSRPTEGPWLQMQVSWIDRKYSSSVYVRGSLGVIVMSVYMNEPTPRYTPCTCYIVKVKILMSYFCLNLQAMKEEFIGLPVCLSVCLSVCLCVQASRSHFLHALPTDFTHNLIPTPGRFLCAFWHTFHFLFSAILLKLIQAILLLFQPPLLWPHHFIMPPFHCSNSECQ